MQDFSVFNSFKNIGLRNELDLRPLACRDMKHQTQNTIQFASTSITERGVQR